MGLSQQPESANAHAAARRNMMSQAPTGSSDDELLQSHSVWQDRTATATSTCTDYSPPTESSIEYKSSPPSDGNDFEHISLPTSEGEEAPGSDFESIGSQELPPTDGGREARNGDRTDWVDDCVKVKNKFVKKYRVKRPPVRRRRLSPSMEAGSSHEYDPDWQQAGPDADAQDLAGPGLHGRLECVVDKAQREGEGTQNSYVSYLVTTDTDFKSFQSSHSQVRRRFTDFVFLHKALAREYPQCAVPPLPEKHNMTHMGVRGDRFSPDFTNRRAYSLQRFLNRLTLHPVLRRATILTLFLESNDWNGIMRSRPMRAMSGSESGNSSVLETWTDTFLNAFSKPHKTDKRFQDVNDRANKLDDDLGTVSKTVARVAKRESDLEGDYADLAIQFQKLAALEPGVQDELTKFATSVNETSQGWKGLKEHTDQDYLGSLRDMESYITSIKSLLKTREQKQLDFEGLTDYLTKAAQDRDTLASHGSMGASGFLRQKIEDVRGVDHEQSRRERQRKLEVQINRLTTEVETAKTTSDAFDHEVIKEVGDFERIKAHEFRDSLGGLADANIAFFEGNIEVWERFIRDMEAQHGGQMQEQAQEGGEQVVEAA